MFDSVEGINKDFMSLRTKSRNFNIDIEGLLFFKNSVVLYRIGTMIYSKSKSTFLGGKFSKTSFIAWYNYLKRESLSSLSTEKSNQKSNGLISK